MDLFWFWWGATHDVGQHVWSWSSRPQEASSEVGSGRQHSDNCVSSRSAMPARLKSPNGLIRSPLQSRCQTPAQTPGASRLLQAFRPLYWQVMKSVICISKFCLFVFWLAAALHFALIRVGLLGCGGTFEIELSHRSDLEQTNSVLTLPLELRSQGKK